MYFILNVIFYVSTWTRNERTLLLGSAHICLSHDLYTLLKINILYFLYLYMLVMF